MALALIIKNEFNKTIYEFVSHEPDQPFKTNWDDFFISRHWENIYEFIDYVEKNHLNLKIYKKEFNISDLFNNII